MQTVFGTAPVTFYAIYYQSEYYYTGTVQTFIAPVNGWYSIKTYGARGAGYNGGALGGFAYGEFYIKAGTELYVLVGESSQEYIGTSTPNGWKGGWNGGGNGNNRHDVQYVVTGGAGSTDVRLEAARKGSTDWKTGMSSRIIVAGGGGGSDDVNHANRPLTPRGGYGGGIVGGSGVGNNVGKGGTQTSGGYGLGVGANSTGSCGGAGGGGYYGGNASPESGGGGGGSSYISGNPQCPKTVPGWEARNSYTTVGGSNHVNGYVSFTLIEK